MGGRRCLQRLREIDRLANCAEALADARVDQHGAAVRLGVGCRRGLRVVPPRAEQRELLHRRLRPAEHEREVVVSLVGARRP